MKYIYIVVFVLSQQLFCSETSNSELLKGVTSITVISHIYPHSLDRSFEETLSKSLSQIGKVIDVDSSESSKKDLYLEAFSNRIFLTLTLHNWITETENHQFKVEIQIALQCSKNLFKSNSDNIIWVEDEFIDFTPNEQKLIELGQRAVNKLAKQFTKEYETQNPKDKENLTFFVL